MRSRREIEKKLYEDGFDVSHVQFSLLYQGKLIVELLLDIRELLEKQSLPITINKSDIEWNHIDDDIAYVPPYEQTTAESTIRLYEKEKKEKKK
jgi:hypothetical protein